MLFLRPLALAGLLACTAAACATPPLTPTGDAATVRQLIYAGGQACAAADPVGAMAAVDHDLVLSYPGVPDMGYAELAAGYQRLCRSEGENTVTSTVPDFEEVTVAGDIAIARLVWNTHLRGMPAGTTRQLRDFQVWRRTADGWKFWRGAHWPAKAAGQ